MARHLQPEHPATAFEHGYDAYWEGICPAAFLFLANAARHSACPGAHSDRKLEGELCTTDGQCESGICGAASGSTDGGQRCLARVERGDPCLADRQCWPNLACQGLRCRSPYTGARVPLGEPCEFSAQCGFAYACLPTGRGIGARAVCARWDLADGEDCTYDRECRSTLCAGGICRAANLAEGAACESPEQCRSGVCADPGDGRRCLPAEVALHGRCAVDGQCPDGSECLLVDVGRRQCEPELPGLGEPCYEEAAISIGLRCAGDDVFCRRRYVPPGEEPDRRDEIAGVCVDQPVPNGFACVTDAHCASGRCRSDGLLQGGECVDG